MLGSLTLQGLEADVKVLLCHREDGAVEVNKRTREVPCNAGDWPGRASLDKEDLGEDLEEAEHHEARKDIMKKNITWKNTNFRRHVVGEVEENNTITFTYVCEHCKMFLVEGHCQPRTKQNITV